MNLITANHYYEYINETLYLLKTTGVLLVSKYPDGRPNPMTIGSMLIGNIWRPTISVFVRPSRYSFTLLEQSNDFVISVPPPELANEVAFCGSASGRDTDKCKEQNLTAIPSIEVRTPSIAECIIHYECKIIHKTNILPEFLIQEHLKGAYSGTDYHRIYHGEIKSVRANHVACKQLTIIS